MVNLHTVLKSGPQSVAKACLKATKRYCIMDHEGETNETAVLKRLCEETWSDINKVQTVLDASPQQGPIRDDDVATTISKIKLKNLQSEARYISEKQPQLLPTNPAVLRRLVLETLDKCVSELQQTMDVVQGQHKDLEEQVKRENKLLAQHEKVRDALQQKIEDSKATSRQQRLVGNEEKKLTAKIENIEKEVSRLMEYMAKFVLTEFPLPSEDKLHPQKSSRTSDTEIKPLLDILEDLMNRSQDAGYNGYLEIDESVWPPYVDMMLRSGIAKRHPKDVNRIRLTAFHLT